MNTILLVISLFLTILFTLVNITGIIAKQNIPAMNFILWALGVLGVLIHYLKIW